MRNILKCLVGKTLHPTVKLLRLQWCTIKWSCTGLYDRNVFFATVMSPNETPEAQRAGGKFALPQPRTNYLKNSFSYSGAVIWIPFQLGCDELIIFVNSKLSAAIFKQ